MARPGNTQNNRLYAGIYKSIVVCFEDAQPIFVRGWFCFHAFRRAPINPVYRPDIKVNQSINQNPWRPGVVGGTPTDGISQFFIRYKSQWWLFRKYHIACFGVRHVFDMFSFLLRNWTKWNYLSTTTLLSLARQQYQVVPNGYISYKPNKLTVWFVEPCFPRFHISTARDVPYIKNKKPMCSNWAKYDPSWIDNFETSGKISKWSMQKLREISVKNFTVS